MPKKLWLIFVVFLGTQGAAWVKAIPTTQAIPTLETALQELAEKAVVSQEALLPIAQSLGLKYSEGYVRVVVEGESGFLTYLSQTGGEVLTGAPEFGLWEVRVPIAQLKDLALLPGVMYVRRPSTPVALAVSQGVELVGAGAWHRAGVTGEGIRVAVIDLEFAGLSEAMALGEVRNVVFVRDYTGLGMESGGPHGVACAEIVSDMAPGAELVLMKIDNEVQLAAAVRDALALGVSIVTHSVAWFNTSFYDGTGIVCDIVRTATDRGVVWVSAAGNYGGGAHWEGDWMDSDGDSFLEFAPGVEINQFYADAGTPIGIWLSWDDWPKSDQDYDLYLIKLPENVLVASSTNVQVGGQPPAEQIFYVPGFPSNYGIVIHAYDAPRRPRLEIFCTSSITLSHYVSESSVVTPADAPFVLAIGTVDWQKWSTGPQEPFSSQGPTNRSRVVGTQYVKPDLVAPDRVVTWGYGSRLFAGTSAASPHVAGAVALVWSANPSWSSAQVQGWLLSNAVDMGREGVDNIFGHGRLNLPVPSTPEEPPDGSKGFRYTYERPGGWWISVPVRGVTPRDLGLTIYGWDGRHWRKLAPEEVLDPLQGYLVRLTQKQTMAVGGQEIAEDQEIRLNRGYSFISSPWRYPVSAILVTRGSETRTWEEAVRAGWVSRTVTGYQASRYVPAGELNPWYGYRVRARVDGLTLTLRYADRLSTTAAPLAPMGVELLDPDWDEPMPEPEGALLEGLKFVNTPNPITDVHTTTFKVVGPMSEFVNEIKVQIFDLSGKLVWEGSAAGAELEWHTEDFAGRYLANGVYLFRIQVEVAGTWVSSGLMKLAIYR
jgi:subtilisin family serine protease